MTGMEAAMEKEIDNLTKQRLEKLAPAIREKIRILYRSLDAKLGLAGAKLPIWFRWDTEALGAYVPEGEDVPEHFAFSLGFLGYTEGSLSAEDKKDLFLHEYAHYMTHHMEIPKSYRFQGGAHGSAWKYCCSLIGAAPSEVHRTGMGKEKHDYSRELRNPINDRYAGERDIHRREQEYRAVKNRIIRYSEGERIEHPKFGDGIIEKIEQTQNSVRLHIRFGKEIKKIDQKWLDRTRYKRRG
ncbi:MAG: hypothetical protein U0L49_07150 [Eubacterium sp.]|nr:hypothetical protein [Eubacterium sp.]